MSSFVYFVLTTLVVLPHSVCGMSDIERVISVAKCRAHCVTVYNRIGLNPNSDTQCQTDRRTCALCWSSCSTLFDERAITKPSEICASPECVGGCVIACGAVHQLQYQRPRAFPKSYRMPKDVHVISEGPILTVEWTQPEPTTESNNKPVAFTFIVLYRLKDSDDWTLLTNQLDRSVVIVQPKITQAPSVQLWLLCVSERWVLASAGLEHRNPQTISNTVHPTSFDQSPHWATSVLFVSAAVGLAFALALLLTVLFLMTKVILSRCSRRQIERGYSLREQNLGNRYLTQSFQLMPPSGDTIVGLDTTAHSDGTQPINKYLTPYKPKSIMVSSIKSSATPLSKLLMKRANSKNVLKSNSVVFHEYFSPNSMTLHKGSPFSQSLQDQSPSLQDQSPCSQHNYYMSSPCTSCAMQKNTLQSIKDLVEL